MTGVDGLKAKAVELLVERVEAKFDAGIDNLSRAISKTVVPQTLGDDQYNAANTDFGFEQMVQVYLYRRLRGFSQAEMACNLQHQPYLTFRFGFDDTTPRQQTLSNTENNRFSDETKRALDIAAKAIAQEADDRTVIVEEVAPTLLESGDDESETEPTKREYTRTQAQKTMRLARNHAIPHFQTDRAENKTYSDTELFDVLARMCATTGSPNSEGEYGWITADDYTPAGSTILRAIKKFATPDANSQQLSIDDFGPMANERPDIAAIRDAAVHAFDLATENVVSSINGATPFADRETIAAIDITYERIYISPWADREQQIPNEQFPDMASGYKKSSDPDDTDKGEIRYGFKYATITLVGENVPIILGVEPVKENSSWESEEAFSYALAEIVDRLLAKAQRFVDIDTVMFDREFYAHAVFNTVNQHDITYVAPKMAYEDDYENIDDIKAHPTADAAVEHGVTSSDGDRSHELDILYVPSREEDGKYAVFATNQRVEPDEITAVTDKYRRRWDIENEYKSIKDFMPRTSSMDYRVRFVNFVFSVLIYNLWRLTDFLIKQALDKPIRSDPVIGGRTFARVIGNFLRRIG